MRHALTAVVAVILSTTTAPAAAPPAVAVPVDPSDVRLLDGPFHDNMVRDQAYLLSLDPDRLLNRFRAEAGLTPKAPTYGGWESEGVSGHTLGHYLSACALMFAASGDPRFRERATYVVDQLAECQDHFNAGGYVAAVPDWRNAFGNIHARGGAMVGWVPWYTLHKEMAGLRDACLYCKNGTAKRVLVRLADWVGVTVAPLKDYEMQGMLEMEQGGIAETLADVYAMTGDPKYVELAKRFTHRNVTDPLAAATDTLNGLHANSQVPKLVGAARIYDLTGDAYFGRAAAFFWQTVVDHRTFATGGNSDSEHFFDPAKAARHLTACTAETCNVYNMLKLTRALYARDPRPAYADYTERALFNQILGSVDPRRGMFTYHQSLRSGGFKIYSDPTNAFWCCVGTGMENHARYGDSIYFHSPAAAAEPTLYVDQFIPSTVTWGDVTVTMETAYPDDGHVKLTVTPKRPTELTIRLRLPGWVADRSAVQVYGPPGMITPGMVARQDGAVTVRRIWSAGDVLVYRLPMAVHVEPLEGSPDMVAFLYGPSVLAADMGTELLDKVNFYQVGHHETRYYTYPGATAAPAVVGSPAELAAEPVKVEAEPATFRLTPAGTGKGLVLRPFARTHFVRYTVYFPAFATAADLARHAADLAAAADRQRRAEARVVDEVRPGEQQSENDHGLQASGSTFGRYGDRHWRAAAGGGSFQYTLAVPAGPAELACTYWGDDTGRTFDVLVNGQKVATESLTGEHPGEFFDRVYAVRADLTRGGSTATVRFVPVGASAAGGVFGVRTLRPE